MEKMITYAHKNNPNGNRFRQYEKDPLPSWAVDVKEEVKIKGQHNGLCNRTTCQSPVHVVYFNHSTRAYYCISCAHLINEANHRESIELYGHDLCTLDIEGKNYE